jgi:hypothetical protein
MKIFYSKVNKNVGRLKEMIKLLSLNMIIILSTKE